VAIKMITYDEILAIYHALVQEFTTSGDPIFPVGVRSEGLLDSAVHRQAAGFGGYSKYTTVDAVGATLVYGMTNNHPFFNGNKRTALVSLLVFLDKNSRTFDGITHKDLYSFITSVSAHTICKGQRCEADDEIEATRIWIRKNSRVVTYGERAITFRDLRRILERFGYTLESPQGNFIDLCTEVEESSLFGLRRRKVRKRLMHIPYSGEAREVGRKLLRHIRKELKLSEEDGIDSEAFYNESCTYDLFIASHRKLLDRLAKN